MIWYLAVCRDCEPILPQPFLDGLERDRWASDHADATNHHVDLKEERWAAAP